MITTWVMLLGFALCQAADNKQQFFADDPKLDKIREDCKKQTKVQDDIAEKIDTGDIDDDSVEKDHNAKCYVSCVLEKSEFAKSGPPSLENIKKLLSLSDPGGIVEIVKKCWSEGRNAGSNSCEGRFVVFKCIMKNGQKTLRSGGEDKKPDDDNNKENEKSDGDGKDNKAGLVDKSNDNSKENDKKEDNGKQGDNKNSDKTDDDVKSGKDASSEKSGESDKSISSGNSEKGVVGSNDDKDNVNKTATS